MKQFCVALTYLVSIALAVLCGFGFCLRLDGVLPLWALIPIYLVLLFVWYELAFLLHEAGHFLAAKLCGWHVKINHISLFDRAYSTSIAPTSTNGLRLKLFFITIAGLLVNLLLLAVAGVVGELLATAWSLPVLAPMAYALVLNLLPFSFQDGKTDGCIANELLNNTDAAKVMLAVYTIRALQNQGNELKDMDEELFFNVPVVQEDDEYFIALTKLRAEYYAAKGQTEKAEEYQKRYQELRIYIS